MTIFFHRLIVIVIIGLTGAAAVGLLAPDATMLILGILTLGLGMILSIMFYLLKPLLIADTFTVNRADGGMNEHMEGEHDGSKETLQGARAHAGNSRNKGDSPHLL